MHWIFDYFRYAWYDLQDARHVRKQYYQDPDFRSLDRSLMSKYILRSPYRISKRFLQKRREKDIYTYGETPLGTFEKMAKAVNVKPLDHVLELGCGRGRGVFFLSHFYNCNVTGIERIPQFIRVAKHVAHRFEVENVSFLCADMFEVDWPKANIIYLFGTCLEEGEIKRVIDKLKGFPKGTRILSVSYPLIDYDQSDTFKVTQDFSVSFPWGETSAYIQEIQ